MAYTAVAPVSTEGDGVSDRFALVLPRTGGASNGTTDADDGFAIPDMLLTAVNGSGAPQFLGHCNEPGLRFYAVELLVPWERIAASVVDMHLQSRQALVRGLLPVLKRLNEMPLTWARRGGQRSTVRPKRANETYCILTDFALGNLGVQPGTNGITKILDLDGLLCAQKGVRLGHQLPCGDGKGSCTERFRSLSPHRSSVFGQIAAATPMDFGCNTSERRCHGLSHASNIWAAGHLLVRPLLGGGHPIFLAMTRPNPDRRCTLDELEQMVRNFPTSLHPDDSLNVEE